MAPASPEYGCSTTSASGTLRDEVDLRLHHGHVAVGAALEHELAPDRAQILQLPGIVQTLTGSTAASAMISSADSPCAAG